jgi:hypothetical protein
MKPAMMSAICWVEQKKPSFVCLILVFQTISTDFHEKYVLLCFPSHICADVHEKLDLFLAISVQMTMKS